MLPQIDLSSLSLHLHLLKVESVPRLSEQCGDSLHSLVCSQTYVINECDVISTIHHHDVSYPAPRPPRSYSSLCATQMNLHQLANLWIHCNGSLATQQDNNGLATMPTTTHPLHNLRPHLAIRRLQAITRSRAWPDDAWCADPMHYITPTYKALLRGVHPHTRAPRSEGITPLPLPQQSATATRPLLPPLSLLTSLL